MLTCSRARIFHQVMTAMRILHHELVEKPKESDKKFKPRKSNPNQWKTLLGPGRDSHGQGMHAYEKGHDRLEEVWVCTAEDAGLAATALQDLIYSWNEGWI